MIVRALEETAAKLPFVTIRSPCCTMTRNSIRRVSENGDDEAMTAFDLIPGAWLMEFEEGWYAYRDDEPRLGPFEGKTEPARAGLKAWSH